MTLSAAYFFASFGVLFVAYYTYFTWGNATVIQALFTVAGVILTAGSTPRIIQALFMLVAAILTAGLGG